MNMKYRKIMKYFPYVMGAAILAIVVAEYRKKKKLEVQTITAGARG